MQRLRYNRRTRSIKTAQRQLDLTSDNTPIHHQAPRDSTSLHSASSHPSTHTGTAYNGPCQHHTQSNRVTCVCVCIHIYYSSACEHMKVSLLAKIRGFFISAFRLCVNECKHACMFFQLSIKQTIYKREKWKHIAITRKGSKMGSGTRNNKMRQ